MSEIVLPVVLPLLGAFMMQPLARLSGAAARALGPIALVAAAWSLAGLWTPAGQHPISVAIGGFAAPLGIVFYADRLAVLLALAVALFTLLLWPVSARDGGDPEQTARADALVLLLVAAAIGLALSGDLFNVYVFYELASVASFGLVALAGTARAQIATFRYLMMSALGSVLALTGVAILYMQTGSLNLAQLSQLSPETLENPLGLAAFALMLLGLGVKAELFPLNSWVPEVYATAPSRVSALLAGVVSKLVAVVLLRLLVLIFPQPEAAQLMLVLGGLGVLTGELAAWRAKDFPRLLAFSSIGQLGLVFIGFSLSADIGLLAGIAVALHHLLIKPALFALAGRWRGAVTGLAGAAKGAPLAAGLFVLFALSLVGVPPLPGFWIKLMLLMGLLDGGSTLQLGVLAIVLVMTAVEAAYFFRLAILLYQPSHAPPEPHGRRDLGAAAVLGATLLAATVLIAPVSERLRDLAGQAGDARLYVDAVLSPSIVRKD